MFLPSYLLLKIVVHGQLRRILLHIAAIFSSQEIPSVYIIHIAVFIIINTVAGYFFRVSPENRPRSSCGINTWINYGHDNWFCFWFFFAGFYKVIGLCHTDTIEASSCFIQCAILGNVSFGCAKEKGWNGTCYQQAGTGDFFIFLLLFVKLIKSLKNSDYHSNFFTCNVHNSGPYLGFFFGWRLNPQNKVYRDSNRIEMPQR